MKKLFSMVAATLLALFGLSAQAQELTPDELRQMFHIIHVDWNTGET